MSGVTNYPIGRLILERIAENAECEADFITGNLGYRDVGKGLRRLHLWTETGAGDQKIITQISRATGRGLELANAIAATREIRSKEFGAEWLERCKSEAATFRPFLNADGSQTVPNGISIFGLTGGHKKWTVTELPQSFLDLPLEDQLKALPEYMRIYKLKYEGQVPFFGTLTGFKLVRLIDYLQFDAECQLVEHVQRPFRVAACSVQLR